MPERSTLPTPWTLRCGLALVGLLALVALSAGILSPHDPVELVDPAASHLLPPGTSLREVRLRGGGRRLAESVRPLPGGIEIRRLGESQRLEAGDLAANDPVGRAYRFPLGSDRFGRDVASRLLYGCRVSLLVGIAAGLLALVLGLLLGASAALGGTLLDNLLMRATDTLLAVPSLFLIIAFAALIRPGITSTIALFGATSWMAVARVARAEILSLKSRDFIVAARTVGLSPMAIFFRHILPNVWTPLVIQVAVLMGNLILAESSLSFIGLGIQSPTPSWGNMIAEGREVLSQAWWISAFPGAALALAIIGFSLLADGLRDRYDPRATDADALPRR